MIKDLAIAIISFHVLVGFANATKSRPEMGNKDNNILKQDVVESSLSMISIEELADFSLGGSTSHLLAGTEMDTSKLKTKSAKAKGAKSTSLPSEDPSSFPSEVPTSSFCRRALNEGELPVQENVPLDRRLEIIKSMEPFGAKRDATFSQEYDLVSKKSCDSLIQHMDTSLQRDIDSGVKLPVGSSSGGAEDAYDSCIPFEEGGLANQYNMKLYANDLVALIGKEETMKIIDFFEKSLDGLTIDCMYLARHGDPADSLFTVPWHMDDYATMEITLNDNYDGGHVLHLNETGVYMTEARPGSVTAHTYDIVHGITPNTNGAKYMLILKHHFNRPEKVGVVRLSKEMVNDLADGK